MGVASHVTKKIHHWKWNCYSYMKRVAGLQRFKQKGLSLFEPDHSLQISRDPFLHSLIWIFFVSFSKANVDHTIGRDMHLTINCFICTFHMLSGCIIISYMFYCILNHTFSQYLLTCISTWSYKNRVSKEFDKGSKSAVEWALLFEIAKN